jgi:hypothetical protein
MTQSTNAGTAQSSAPVGLAGILGLSAYLIILTLLLLYALVRFWPAPAGPEGAASNPPETFFAWTITVSEETRLLIVVILAGALGGLVHALRSFYWYVGNRMLMWSWAAQYVLLPFVASALGLVFYLVFRGGFFSTQATASEANPFAFAALSGLVGLFSHQAILKLKDVAQTLLAKPRPGADAKPED